MGAIYMQAINVNGTLQCKEATSVSVDKIKICVAQQSKEG